MLAKRYTWFYPSSSWGTQTSNPFSTTALFADKLLKIISVNEVLFIYFILLLSYFTDLLSCFPIIFSIKEVHYLVLKTENAQPKDGWVGVR